MSRCQDAAEARISADIVSSSELASKSPSAKQLPEQQPTATKTQPASMAAQPDYRIGYKTFQWVFIIFFTLVAVIDRFTLNMWPLWVDSPGPTIPGNFGVTCFALIAWISSRMMLVSSSYIFLFECRIFWNWFVERKWVHRYLKIGDIHQSNDNIHSHVGIWMVGVPVVLHVWVILFAAVLPQNDIYVYGSWMRPVDPVKGTSIAFYSDNLLSLGINDVYRIVSTSLTFFVLLPYSIIKFTRDRNWTFAQYCHYAGALIYTVDLIRMTSHPHCWVFNCPFIAWWMCDRLYGIFFYRRCVANVVRKVRLDDDYTVLYLRIPERLHQLNMIGDVFYINTVDCAFDRAHPFTVFQNHARGNSMINDEMHHAPDWDGHKFTVRRSRRQSASHTSVEMSRLSSGVYHSVDADADADATLGGDDDVDATPGGDDDVVSDQTMVVKKTAGGDEQESDADLAEFDWNVGVIMAVFPDHNDCYRRKTWTKKVSQDLDLHYTPVLRCWGPFRSEYRTLLRPEDSDAPYPATPLVLIATGAGSSYLVDFYNYITGNNLKLHRMVQMYFSTRSISMFQWFTDITCPRAIDNFAVNAHLTSHGNVKYDPKPEKSRDSKIGRLSFEEILQNAPPDTNVFFCGAPGVQESVGRLCAQRSLTFHAGHSFY